jgi:RNA polymerase sigma factor (sigma-70 family)
MIPDCELLRRYAELGDEAAFAEMVGRHVDLVYSAALRLVGGDAHLAQDVAQGVFTALARRAARLARHASIVGWLYTTTRYTAGNLRREQHRRVAREQEAYAMNQPAHSSEVNWAALQPVLDEAVCALAATDREAVLLRFFQNKSHREVGDALGLGEEAARKRVDRALEKLRAHFGRRGVAVSAGVLAATIGANSVQAAPVGLAASLTGTSLAGAGGGALSSSFIKTIVMTTKTKLALVGVVAITGFALWWFIRPAAVIPEAPMPTKFATTKTVATTAQVEPPKLPPVTPKPEATVFAPTPASRAEEAKTELSPIIAGELSLYESGSTYVEVLSKYSARIIPAPPPPPPPPSPPPGMAGNRSSSPPARSSAEQETSQLEIATLKAIQDATPTLNDAGDVATYIIDPATWDEIHANDPMAMLANNFAARGIFLGGYERKIEFRKVNGQWYIGRIGN